MRIQITIPYENQPTLEAICEECDCTMESDVRDEEVVTWNIGGSLRNLQRCMVEAAYLESPL